MFRSWKLGTAFGIGIYVHWTFLLLLAWVFLTSAGPGHYAAAVYEMVLISAIFGCVVLHELGHALTARHFGIGTRDITLYPIGGVARLERLSERPMEEFWIALAGPAVNVGIAFLLGGLLRLGRLDLGGNGFLDSVQQGQFLQPLLFANILLVLFNLLPAFPLDGGRVLRAILATYMGRLRATEIAAKLGIAMAVVFFVLGLGILEWPPAMPMLVLVAIFIYFAGQQELAAVRHRETNRWTEPLELHPAEPCQFSQQAGWAGPGFSGFTWDEKARLWIQWHNGRPIHTISAN
jgi:Zn-dependent protease